jgi:hypothetical protein
VTDVQVTCTDKTNRFDHEAITHLGGHNWHLPKQEVVIRIDSRLNRFFTHSGPYRAWLRTRLGRGGVKYVQTESDPTPQNNLLNLPDCR